MRILFPTAELAPLARVGGLAEATAGLLKMLRMQGAEVTPVLPDYGNIELTDEESFDLDVPSWCGPVRARCGRAGDTGEVILIDAAGLARPHPYVDPNTGDGWPDNDARFFTFSAAIAALAGVLKPDVLHLNDWHTAASIGFMADPPPTVLTIHTLGYQGVCDANWLQRIPFDPWRFSWYDVANPLVGAIRSVDKIIAVSPNYAREMLTQEQGMGMHLELERRGDALVGIRNGIDTSIWNPETDPHVAHPYTAADVEEGSKIAKAALLEEAGWDDDGSLILGVVSRLVDQKGIDLVAGLVPYLETIPAKLLLLGSGLQHIADEIRAAADERPDLVWAVTDRFDEPLAHRIFAGADLFLMPSRFEPCGLAQMQAMAYGTVPVATRVGGLVDTIIDTDENRDDGTGFLTITTDLPGLVDAVHRAARSYRLAARRKAMRKRGMSIDWSWDEPARAHLELYHELAD